jgi:hypothetical protein
LAAAGILIAPIDGPSVGAKSDIDGGDPVAAQVEPGDGGDKQRRREAQTPSVAA